jgi:plastocyanin
MPAKKSLSIMLCMLLLAAAGCKQAPTAASAPAKNYTTIDWANAGTIVGTIHFVGKAPDRITIDMGQDPACSLAPANLTEQYIIQNGGLLNTFVFIKDGLGDKAYAPPSAPVVMDQKGCRFVPHVIGVMAGQPVKFTNGDATMHNVHMTPTLSTNQTVDISQPPNGPGDTRALSTPELMIPVRCNNHPWMEGYINVVSNPFYAVSAEDGHFTIKGVPPGNYIIEADHEQLGQKTAQITVSPQRATIVDITYEMPAGQK